MGSDNLIELAAGLFKRAFEAQSHGDLDAAVDLYKRSLQAYPTAEAHTFLGWTYSFQGDLAAAIEECQKAIAVDPDFGNPYNDIGAYLLELGRPDEAIPWLEKATRAARYEPRHFPHVNLGRAYAAKEMLSRALEEFQKALALAPENDTTQAAIATLKRKLN